MTTEYTHTPVMCEETLDLLAPQSGSIVVDATLGRVGHGRLLAQAAMKNGGTYIGIDLDEQALEAAQPILAKVQEELAEGEYLLIQGSFGDLDTLLQSAGIAYVDTFLFDIGVSSPQIDDAQRGFSFKQDTVLDMRLDQGANIPTAADLLQDLDGRELTRILRDYGEEKWASRIANFIVKQRESAPITSSTQLVELIKAAIPASARRAGGHPAKRSFQALRIAVNDELGALERGLEAAIRWLRPGGRLGVLTFHSLEDRIVKRAFQAAEQSCSCPPSLPVCMCEETAVMKVLTKRPLQPTTKEIESNPRARSTKLRVAEKLRT
ncbi:MAG: 16S rRNA (cytosine(1402)-N(4))-methyltransferase RsmH [Coriobacteriia bacterium]|nr:16S rRNA (cytosine(1402)-N(4))-methyltransferase RsmH [Coriobacteriia bacterium]